MAIFRRVRFVVNRRTVNSKPVIHLHVRLHTSGKTGCYFPVKIGTSAGYNEDLCLVSSIAEFHCSNANTCTFLVYGHTFGKL